MRTYNGIERPDFTPEFITELKSDEVFVFGSNLAGMHGGVETIKPYVDDFISFAKEHPDRGGTYLPLTNTQFHAKVLDHIARHTLEIV